MRANRQMFALHFADQIATLAKTEASCLIPARALSLLSDAQGSEAAVLLKETLRRNGYIIGRSLIYGVRLYGVRNDLSFRIDVGKIITR